MDGFFPASLVAATAPSSGASALLAKCGSCGLRRKCDTPHFPVAGKGRKRILVVLDTPSSSEDATGEALNGKSGASLKKLMASFGIDLLRDCWVAYAVQCHSPKPDTQHATYCLPNLVKTLKLYEPVTVIPMGSLAIHGVVAHTWKDTVEETSRFHGYVIPSQRLNAWICPTLSVVEILKARDKAQAILTLAQRKHLKVALAVAAKGERPYKEVPKYEEQVEVIMDTDEAARRIRRYIALGGVTAFDYEANSLKPEWAGTALSSAAICWRGRKTIAFLLHGEAEVAVKEYLASGIPVIAANMKYEQRWTRRKFGFRIRNLVWDTMLAHHVLDNRPGTKSIKFIAYVLLGQPAWNEHIEPYLRSKQHEHINRIREIDVRQLLVYNGLDSLLEYVVAKYQIPRVARGLTIDNLSTHQW